MNLPTILRAELSRPLREFPAIMPETTLEDLGADAIDRVTLSMALEDEFGIVLHDVEFSAGMSVGEIEALVRGKVGAAACG